MAGAQASLKDFLEVLAGIAPPSLAEAWDNVGLMVGDPDCRVDGVMVAIDASEETLTEAKDRGCNVILTHHPLIFKPLQAVRADRVIDRLLVRALSEGTAVVSCHTNLDKVTGGVNDALADALGLANCRVLAPEGGGADVIGFGRIGELVPPISFAAFIDNMLRALDLEAVRIAGPAPEKVATVAVCGGSGSELAETALAAGAGVFVTGEVKNSTARWAEDAGLCVIDAGHFSTEKIVLPGLAAAVAKIRDEKEWRFEVCCSKCQTSPFRYFYRK